jgi:NTP pyrophosphatase (non-canonical NTP hydrolase)
MTLQEAQKSVDDWIKEYGVRYFSELTNMAMLTEEVGEVARIIARQYGDQSFKPSDRDKQLDDELADVLFVLICLANQTGIDLEAAFNATLPKKLRGTANATRTTKSSIKISVKGIPVGKKHA